MKNQNSPFQQARPSFRLSNYADLLLIITLALILPVVVELPLPQVRVLLGLGMVLIVPGYALVSAVFVQESDLDRVARFGLGFGLSLAILPVLALLLNILPWGLRLWPMVICLMILVITLSTVAMWRRMRLQERSLITQDGNGGVGLESGRFLKLGLGLFAVLIVGGLIWGGYAGATAGSTSRYTEFYALSGPGQTSTEAYGQVVKVNSPVEIKTQTFNRETGSMTYWIEVRSDGRLLARLGPGLVKEGEKWDQSLNFTLDQVGDDQKIDLLLFKDSQPTPYRQLHLWLNVRL